MKSSYKTNSSKKPLGKNGQTEEVSTFRRLLPQILASTIKNFLLLDLGLSVAFPTIVIPALTGLDDNHNVNEYLHLTPSQASWFGSIAYICQPVGSLMSGWIMEPLGRKRAMFFVNIPHVIAWILLYNATTIFEVFLGNIMLGLGVGLMEAPIITYVGEICEPSIRGILTACAGIAATLGFFIIFLMGSLMAWRDVAMICLAIPLITMVAVCFIPETPLWLLSKNRTDDALKSLQWLRGWVSPEAVEHEFQSLQRYNERSNSCNLCTKQNVKCPHPPPTLLVKLKELTRKRTLKPFLLVMSIFLLSEFTGLLAMRPYMVQILKAYGVPIDANWATVIFGFIGLSANIILLCVIRLVGKRKIFLTSLAATFTSCLTLGVYGFFHFPSGWTSFEKHVSMEGVGTNNYLPLFIILMLSFCTNLGLASLPWMLLSEVFPFRSRGFATGIAAGLNYIMAFVATKTYYNLETSLSIPGVTLLYGVVGVFGFIAMYKVLPETENCTLEDIELHFSDNSRKITDRKIMKSSPTKHTGGIEAAIPGKPISIISDTIEMNNGTPSVVGSNGLNGDGGDGGIGVISSNGIHQTINNGCDNKAFTPDR